MGLVGVIGGCFGCRCGVPLVLWQSFGSGVAPNNISVKTDLKKGGDSAADVKCGRWEVRQMLEIGEQEEKEVGHLRPSVCRGKVCSTHAHTTLHRQSKRRQNIDNK